MWPFKKKPAPVAKRAYAGANYGRLVADWVSSNTSMDSEVRSSLTALRNRSRQLARDNDYAKDFFQRDLPNNVVGQGIPFQAQVRMQRGGALDERTNDLIERAWLRWCRKDNCHTAGTLAFSDIERLAIRSVGESGEMLVRFIYQRMGAGKVPFALELIEADLLDETYNGVHTNGNQVRMGVEVNQWRRPVAYHFLSKHPGDYQASAVLERRDARIRIPANEVLHLFVPERISQTRGVPWLASAIMRLHHMEKYEEAEIISARATAAVMGFIESPEGEPSADGVEDGDRVTDFAPGIFKYLAPGEKVNVPTISRPGGQFDPFMRLMLRGVAAAAGTSYESVSKDYSQSNYSSSRMAMLKERDNWRVLQQWMIANFQQAVFERWLDMSVLSGELSLKNYETNPEIYQGVKWMPRGWSFVDPQKEISAYKDAVRSGFMTQTEVVAQSGGDIEELMAQRKREVDIAEDLGLVFDTDPQLVSGAGLTQARPTGSEAPDASGETSGVGKKPVAGKKPKPAEAAGAAEGGE